MIAPNPAEARYTGLLKWPNTALSTKPTRGTDKFENINGRAIFSICLSVAVVNICYVISIMSKSDLVAPQSGHIQVSGTSSHFVPG